MEILARKFKSLYFRFPVSNRHQILPVDAVWGPVQGAGIRAQLSQTVQKLFKKNHFRNFAKIGFLRSEGHKIPKEENPRDTVPRASYPHSICVGQPSLKKICNNVFEKIATGTTPENDV